MKHVVALCMMSLVVLTNTKTTLAQSNQQIQKYIEKYRSLAMSEQQRSGIPAAIKLAQGIHETGAGTSALAINANNHFGLKCKRGWNGQTYTYSDNRPNECFRKYAIDFESYQDHSNYLKANPRYAALFKLSVTDYAAWAMELRKAGYATNPDYAQNLIKLVETYRLQQYTYLAMGNEDYQAQQNVAQQYVAKPQQNTRSNRLWNKSNRSATPVATNPRYQPQSQPVASTQPQRNTYGNRVQATTPQQNTYGSRVQATTPVQNTTAQPQQNTGYSKRSSSRYSYRNSGQRAQQQTAQTRQIENRVVRVNNLKAVYGKKGDMPLQYAVKNNIRYQKFLEMNDLEDAPLPADMPLYLERKHFWGIRPMHLVKPYETMIQIAQQEGIQLKYLRDLNYMEEGEEPMPGVTLELQAQAAEKPKLKGEEPKRVIAQKPMKKNPMQRTPDTGPFGLNISKKEETTPVSNPRYRGAQQRNNRTASNATYNRNAQPVQRTQPSQPANNNSISDRIINDANSAQNYTMENDDATYGSSEDEYDNDNTASNQSSTHYNNPRYVDPNARNASPTPPPPAPKSAKELRREQKEARRLAKERAKYEAEQKALVDKQYGGRPQQPVQQAPVQQQPKNEYSELTDQFDNIIYSQNNNQQVNRQPVQQRQPQRDPSKYYNVQAGDTAYTIAKKHGITVRQLMDWNGLDFDAIKPGQSLRIKQ